MVYAALGNPGNYICMLCQFVRQFNSACEYYRFYFLWKYSGHIFIGIFCKIRKEQCGFCGGINYTNHCNCWLYLRLDALFMAEFIWLYACLLYTSPSPRDGLLSRM